MGGVRGREQARPGAWAQPKGREQAQRPERSRAPERIRAGERSRAPGGAGLEDDQEADC